MENNETQLGKINLKITNIKTIENKHKYKTST